MRLKISLARQEGDMLPFNYQHPVSSWIYRVLGKGNEEFASYLHEQGYGEGNQRFKFFNFGLLNSTPYTPIPQLQAMRLEGDTANIILSFYLPEAFNDFITGLFYNQKLFLNVSGEAPLILHSRTVEILPKPDFSALRYYQFRCITPMTLSYRATEEQANASYIPPEHEEFKATFLQNCLNKYNALKEKRRLPDINLEDLDFQLLSTHSKAKLITLKANTPQQTKVKGFLFDFAFKAPQEMIELCYYGGFGDKASMGFGFVERR